MRLTSRFDFIGIGSLLLCFAGCRAAAPERAVDGATPQAPALAALAAELAASEIAKPLPPVRISDASSDAANRLPPPQPPAREYPSATIEQRVRAEGAGDAAALARRITRTADRVHVIHVGGDDEWLFVQNPRDAAHFHATRVVHDHRELVEYPMTELRVGGIATSWDAIECFGLESVELAGLEATGETRHAFGLEFRRLTAPQDSIGRRVQEVWWNGEHAVAGSVVFATSAGRIELETTALELGVDRAVLEDPSLRFPDYRVFDVGDWLESLHDH